jgi:hypothetical protein
MLERELGKLGELERGPYPPLLKGPISWYFCWNLYLFLGCFASLLALVSLHTSRTAITLAPPALSLAQKYILTHRTNPLPETPP